MESSTNSIALWNLRSLYNVGAITRSAVSFGVTTIYCIGTTPYPEIQDDSRLPHVRKRATKEIAKTALGAEQNANYHYFETLEDLLQMQDTEIILGLEQSQSSITLTEFQPPTQPWMLIVGEETKGLPQTVLAMCHATLEISQPGTKKSLNVAAASAIALHHLCVASISKN